MKKSRICALGAAAVIGAALATTGASAAMAATPNPNTAVTFTVTNGALTIDAPFAVALVPQGTDTGLPASNVVGVLGTTTVTDNRAALLTPWTASVSETDFDNTTTGGLTAAEIIPATDALYDPGTVTVAAGNVTASGTPITLSNGGGDVVTDAGSGDNVVTWNATMTLAIPATAVAGDYTGTLTSSVI